MRNISKKLSKPLKTNIFNKSIIFLLFILLIISNKERILFPYYKYINNKNSHRTTPSNSKIAKPSISFLSNYQNISQLASSSVLIADQKRGIWENLSCISTINSLNMFRLKDINTEDMDPVLLKGLKDIENYDFTIKLKNEDGSLNREYISKQEISFTNICEDEKVFYVLFLTTEDKKKTLHNTLIEPLYAAGGYLGQSNFAIISKEGEVRIYESFTSDGNNKTSINKQTGVAYFACHTMYGKINKVVYVGCGGEGGSNLYKIETDNFSIQEIAFCKRSYTEGLNICYDFNGQIYLREKL